MKKIDTSIPRKMRFCPVCHKLLVDNEICIGEIDKVITLDMVKHGDLTTNDIKEWLREGFEWTPQAYKWYHDFVMSMI